MSARTWHALGLVPSTLGGFAITSVVIGLLPWAAVIALMAGWGLWVLLAALGRGEGPLAALELTGTRGVHPTEAAGAHQLLAAAGAPPGHAVVRIGQESPVIHRWVRRTVVLPWCVLDERVLPRAEAVHLVRLSLTATPGPLGGPVWAALRVPWSLTERLVLWPVARATSVLPLVHWAWSMRWIWFVAGPLVAWNTGDVMNAISPCAFVTLTYLRPMAQAMETRALTRAVAEAEHHEQTTGNPMLSEDAGTSGVTPRTSQEGRTMNTDPTQPTPEEGTPATWEQFFHAVEAVAVELVPALLTDDAQDSVDTNGVGDLIDDHGPGVVLMAMALVVSEAETQVGAASLHMMASSGEAGMRLPGWLPAPDELFRPGEPLDAELLAKHHRADLHRMSEEARASGEEEDTAFGDALAEGLQLMTLWHEGDGAGFLENLGTRDVEGSFFVLHLLFQVATVRTMDVTGWTPAQTRQDLTAALMAAQQA